MKLFTSLKCLMAAGYLLSAPMAVAQNAARDDWQFTADVYLWMPSLSSETRSGDKVNVKFRDILKNLNFGAMGYLTARRGPFALYLDAIYLNLDNKQSTSANIVGFPVSLATKLDLQGVISTFGAGYRFLETENTKLEAAVGGRLLWLDSDLRFDVAVGGLGSRRLTASASGVNVDAVIGLRGRTDLDEDWFLTYEADIGTGQSDLTWQVWGTVNYKLENVTLTAGYRYMGWNFDNNSKLLSDLKLHGPVLGVKFDF